MPLTQTSAAITTPASRISIGGGGAGGLSGVAALVGGAVDPWQRSLVSLQVQAAPAPWVDFARIVTAADSQSPDVAVDDAGGIELGPDQDTFTEVFNGTVGALRHTLFGVKHCILHNGAAVLAKLRINQSYEKQSAGDIVSDLAAQAGVETDSVESGPDLPFYVIDDRCSVWAHMALLAQKCGYAAYFSPQNKLCFGPLSEGRAVQTFTYAVDILAFEARQAENPPDTFVVVGEGAAGSQGDEAWSWLIKDPGAVMAEAGDGPARKVLTVPALRSAQAVQVAADGLAAAALRKMTTGRMIAAGAPAVVVGATIEVADLPESALNGTCLVMRVVHEFSKRGGYISRIDFCKPGDSGVGGPL